MLTEITYFLVKNIGRFCLCWQERAAWAKPRSSCFTMAQWRAYKLRKCVIANQQKCHILYDRHSYYMTKY